MKQYSIFWSASLEKGNFYPIYLDKDGGWWLGGSCLQSVGLFSSKEKATKVLNELKKQKYYTFQTVGNLVVKRAVISTYSEIK